MRTVLILALSLSVLSATGCSGGRPNMPSLTGPNMLHDITQVRKGMSPNEVRRVMGSHFDTVWEEGIQGIDGGNYIWAYAEGKVYFNTDGVTRVVPTRQ